MKIKRVDYHTFLLKEFIIRRFETIYSTFLLKTFIIRCLRVDYSTLLHQEFFDRRLLVDYSTLLVKGLLFNARRQSILPSLLKEFTIRRYTNGILPLLSG